MQGGKLAQLVQFGRLLKVFKGGKSPAGQQNIKRHPPYYPRLQRVHADCTVRREPPVQRVESIHILRSRDRLLLRNELYRCFTVDLYPRRRGCILVTGVCDVRKRLARYFQSKIE